MENSYNSDYKAVLRDLRAQHQGLTEKVKKLEITIQYLEDLASTEKVSINHKDPERPASAALFSSGSTPFSTGLSSFATLSVVEASIALLRETKVPMHVSDIVEELNKRGKKASPSGTPTLLSKAHLSGKTSLCKVDRGLWGVKELQYSMP